MQLYDGTAPVAAERCAAALGFFDGVHLGHRAVIAAADRWAAEHAAETAVFTFDLPLGSRVKAGGRLLSDDEKHRRLASVGVRHCVQPPFEAFRGLSPEQFVDELLVGVCHAKAVFCGDNFTFGKNKAGTARLLVQLCAQRGIEAHILPMAQYEGQPVSSTRIRAALAEGKIEEVNAMLGEDYCIDFAVRHGRQLGRTLGFPTINQIYPAGMQMPKSGVYITQVMLEDGSLHPGATGLGSRPTVGGEGITCETFLPGFSGQLYGSRVRLRFCRWLKPTVKFDTLAQLTDYVSGAADAALAWFGGQSETGEANH